MMFSPEFIRDEIYNLDLDIEDDYKAIMAIDAKAQEILWSDDYLAGQIMGILDTAIHCQDLPEFGSE